MAEAVQDPVLHLKSGWNRLCFALRNAMPWSWGNYQEPTEPKKHLYDGRSGARELMAREFQLVEKYGLQSFRSASSRLRYVETLTCLDYLDRLLVDVALPTPADGTPMAWLDVGAKNWAYVEALYRYARQHPSGFRLHGIELDGYRRYINGHTRAGAARSFIRDYPEATYHVGDVMAHYQRYDVITWFLPFVFPQPCVAWGLPLSCYKPQAMLDHVVSLLNPGGILVILNQGQDEADEQGRLLISSAKCRDLCCLHQALLLPESFAPFRYSRYGWVCRKTAAESYGLDRLPMSQHASVSLE